MQVNDLREMTLLLMRAENLSRAEAREFLSALINPAVTDAQVAAALAVLAVKGETVDELAGMAEAMRERALRLYSKHARFVDTAGTGSSAVKTFNVSTAAAFVIAGAGLPVAKHGSRAATSHSGSADFHRATARVAQVRRELGMHTTFNLLGPLTNPARAPFQILGVWHRSLVERVAAVLGVLGTKKAWVVHGADGLDEITLTGDTFVACCSANSDKPPVLETFTVTPENFGLERRSLGELCGGGPLENAELIRSILYGDTDGHLSVARDLVIINSAAALYLSGFSQDLPQAAMMARESIDSGCAASKLDVLIQETNRKQ